jgi:hypothetical protein
MSSVSGFCRGVAPPGGERGAGQDAVLDRAQLRPPFGLPLGYRLLAEQGHEVVVAGVPVAQPRVVAANWAV